MAVSAMIHGRDARATPRTVQPYHVVFQQARSSGPPPARDKYT
jgi:hypothetical protein